MVAITVKLFRGDFASSEGVNKIGRFIVQKRRDFFKLISKWIFGLGVLLSPLAFFLKKSNSHGDRKLIPKDIEWTDLRNWNPKDLDASNLKITPLNNFGTMGLEDYSANLSEWRFVVDGHVKRVLNLKYEDLLSLDSIEKPVLMICPGFFVNHGLWKGVSIEELFRLAPPKMGVTHVTFRGPEGNYEKVTRVPLEDALAAKIFVAYQVNGERLPQKHGFPLRLVAEGYYGYDWVKYVYKMTADVIET